MIDIRFDSYILLVLSQFLKSIKGAKFGLNLVFGAL